MTWFEIKSDISNVIHFPYKNVFWVILHMIDKGCKKVASNAFCEWLHINDAQSVFSW